MFCSLSAESLEGECDTHWGKKVELTIHSQRKELVVDQVFDCFILNNRKYIQT